MRTTNRRRAALAAGVVGIALLAAACGGGSGPGDGTSTQPSARPSSPAKVAIESPKNGQTFTSGTIPVRIKLTGARIVPRTSLHITPTTGHLHLYVDDQIVSMNYKAVATLKDIKPGLHDLRVEFVAADHLPFDPRVIADVSFEVKS
jgi:Family of unknown function (DUF6130)